MAISETHYKLLRELKQAGVLPQGGSILEIGRAGFYGDMSIGEILNDCRDAVTDGVLNSLWDCQRRNGGLNGTQAFCVARSISKIMFDVESKDIVAIDGDPSAEDAIPLDLNDPIDLGRQFDVVINHGTMEHLSQDLECQRTIHKHCKPGGLIIHEAPLNQTGHGQRSYNFNFFDGIAKANKYEIVRSALQHLPSRTYFDVRSEAQVQNYDRAGMLVPGFMWFIAMRKTTDEPYQHKWVQDIYAGRCEDGRALMVQK